MFEKVNKFHPDKVADRIGGAIVDLAYKRNKDARIAVEVLIGHGNALIIAETNTLITEEDVEDIILRLVGPHIKTKLVLVPQDSELADNQKDGYKCGDNGIFKGCLITHEQMLLADFVTYCDGSCRLIDEYGKAPCSDGKYIINKAEKKIIICQSKDVDNVFTKKLAGDIYQGYEIIINPLGYWMGGINVDSGATNRKLGSDMGDAVTGGGLHGKDISKADVTVNIWCHLKAQKLKREVTAYCAIGDTVVHTSEGDVEFTDMVEVARKYINEIGGFEKFAEYGLIR